MIGALFTVNALNRLLGEGGLQNYLVGSAHAVEHFGEFLAFCDRPGFPACAAITA